MSSPLALLHYGEAQPLGARTAVGANMAVRRSVLDALGGFAPHLGRNRGTLLCGEDHDFCQRVASAGYRSEYRPELKVRHWVPASRLRLRYFLRWFFWSGVTNAVLEEDGRRSAADAAGPAVPLYLVRRVATSSISTLIRLLSGRIPEAARCVMEIAFALGFVTQYIRSRWTTAGSAAMSSRTYGSRRCVPSVPPAESAPPGRTPDQALGTSKQTTPAM
jgi:cellulose synthase/poly-beta-1,6-N-acetylglucosamine synthase-like glycosyltransferase